MNLFIEYAVKPSGGTLVRLSQLAWKTFLWVYPTRMKFNFLISGTTIIPISQGLH